MGCASARAHGRGPPVLGDVESSPTVANEKEDGGRGGQSASEGRFFASMRCVWQSRNLPRPSRVLDTTAPTDSYGVRRPYTHLERPLQH
jgi:hypothetical protein